MRDTPVDLFIRGLVYIANSLGVAAAAPLPPSPPTRSVASFDGKMVGTAVLLMTRFFAKPIDGIRHR